MTALYHRSSQLSVQRLLIVVISCHVFQNCAAICNLPESPGNDQDSTSASSGGRFGDPAHSKHLIVTGIRVRRLTRGQVVWLTCRAVLNHAQRSQQSIDSEVHCRLRYGLSDCGIGRFTITE
jgi:hypothetical protein